MSGDEEFVRSVWTLVHCCDGSYRAYPRGTVLMQIKNHVFVDAPTWSAAAAFTRERLEEIRQLREEIDSALSDVRWFAKGEQYEDRQQEAIHRRILARLEAELARLTVGMREAQ